MEIGPIFRALRHNRTKVVLLVLEIGVTLAIVLNCLAMLIDQRAELERPSGLDEENIVAVRAEPFGTAYEDDEFVRQLGARDLERLRALPGVISASAISNWPLKGGGSSFQVSRMDVEDAPRVRSPYYRADERFIDTLGLELVAGRAFTPADIPVESGPHILNIIVTQALADALFPEGGALGQAVNTGSAEYPDVIVGIVREMHTPYGGGPMEDQITFYPGMPVNAQAMQYLVRTEPAAYDGVLRSVEQELLGNDPERVVAVKPLLEVKGRGYLQNRFIARILGVIIGLLLFVAALGIFGMTSSSVAQRTKQIGTRRALGATRGEVVRYFVVESALVTAIGTGLGLVAAYGLNVALVRTGGGVPLAPGLVLAGLLILWLVALLATVVPARRAARLSPALATRTV